MGTVLKTRLSCDGIHFIREAMAAVHRAAGGAGEGYDETLQARVELGEMLDNDGCETVEMPVPSDEDVPGYARAASLLRNGHPSASDVADALGGASADGPQGNIWALFDQRYRTFAYAPAVVLEPGRIEEIPAGTRISTPVPEGIAHVSVVSDASHDGGGSHVCMFGWNEDGSKGWLLNHLFIPAQAGAA